MGGWGSGRSGGRPIAEHCLRIDLTWMLRKGLAREGQDIRGTLRWQCGGSPSGSISYRADLSQSDSARLELTYTRGSGDDAENVRQTVSLCHTAPHYGGKRWWMICPSSGHRVGKLYLPPGGDRFASRKVWRVGYQSQRDAARDKPFSRLNRLQAKLGCEEGWGSYPRRPKGMWQRTFDRHLAEYWDLDDECSLVMMDMIGRLGR